MQQRRHLLFCWLCRVVGRLNNFQSAVNHKTCFGRGQQGPFSERAPFHLQLHHEDAQAPTDRRGFMKDNCDFLCFWYHCPSEIISPQRRAGCEVQGRAWGSPYFVLIAVLCYARCMSVNALFRQSFIRSATTLESLMLI